jgi:hypothetical protein
MAAARWRHAGCGDAGELCCGAAAAAHRCRLPPPPPLQEPLEVAGGAAGAQPVPEPLPQQVAGQALLMAASPRCSRCQGGGWVAGVVPERPRARGIVVLKVAMQ